MTDPPAESKQNGILLTTGLNASLRSGGLGGSGKKTECRYLGGGARLKIDIARWIWRLRNFTVVDQLFTPGRGVAVLNVLMVVAIPRIIWA